MSETAPVEEPAELENHHVQRVLKAVVPLALIFLVAEEAYAILQG